ncbi:MAG: TonB-dependent receptor [Gammaproteobacteria bacterium]|nr:TonB-dependent receptor [Gammaproteobacteria bacterium]
MRRLSNSGRVPRHGRWLAILAALLNLLYPQTASAEETGKLDEIVVTSQRREQPRLLHTGNIERLDEAMIDSVRHQHIHELLTRVAGVWLSRGSGQEHLTAIRSPVLTGAGSCGAFLFLEDGIPIRPAGFCNVNSLFEINTEQAQAIEVIRGPGNALYGSNALHGIVNVLMPSPDSQRTPGAAVELGANNYFRGRASLPFAPEAPWLASVVYTDDGGFRDDTGYRQGKLHLKRNWTLAAGDLLTGLTFTDLDQETAGFIIGEDAYKDTAVKRSNPNPEAFRKATSLRAYGKWTRPLSRFDLDLRPYLRYSDMEFLQHFLPGQPLEENGHTSAGVIASVIFRDSNVHMTAGVDVEWSDMFLEETQATATEGSAFLVETRPVGKHYDYTVTSLAIAPYLQTEYRAGERLTIGAGLRLDYLHYDYDNRMLDGNTRDDGTPCGFGGCLYSRPADRSDGFTNLAPKFSVNYTIGPTSRLYAVLARGFRAPQATELYRLQSGQQIADLDSEQVDSFEIGVRTAQDAITTDISLFAMNKRDSIFRDSEGFNVSGGRTEHRGVELSVDWQLRARLMLSLDASYARHRYDFDVIAARGETFASGREVDTAPRWLGSLELDYAALDAIDVGLQVTSIGNYYLDAENQFRYPGHTIGNLRAALRLAPKFSLVLRLNNVTDRDIADRADYAFGNYRYFPGRGREFFAEFQYSPTKESL